MCNKFGVILGHKILLHIQFSAVMKNSSPPPCPPPHYFNVTPATLKLAEVHHLGPATKSQLFYKSLNTSLRNSDTNSLCVCLEISRRRLFSCLDTCKVKPILNKHLQNVWQTFDTHCQMFVQYEWCVCCDIHFIRFTTSWHFYQLNHRCATVQYLSCYHEWLR